MASQNLVQNQTLKQTQTLSPQQVMAVRILEMPIVQLEERVKNEVIDNVMLNEKESKGNDDVDDDDDVNVNDDNVLWDEDDEDGGYNHHRTGERQEYELAIGSTKSFSDELYEQVAEYSMTDQQLELTEYLIGSLNEDGFIDTPLQKISDDLLIYHNTDVSVGQLEEVLRIIQNFDPPGIGARNLQESLSIQLRRIDAESGSEKGRIRELAVRIVEECYDEFILQRTSLIAKKMKADEHDVELAVTLIGRMNPAPGRALNESATDRVQSAVPDVIIETNPEGGISYAVNDGNMPQLEVNTEYAEQLADYQKQTAKTDARTRSTMSYLKQKMDGAGMFINAIEQRRHTLDVCTKAIIGLQKDFILSQDDNDLKPMTLSDVAEIAGVDVSTVSRVKSYKYVLLDGSLLSFSHFFIRARHNAAGQVVIGNDINSRIKAIIDNESKEAPYDDDKIVDILTKQGMNISRRTVAKYRKNLGYPIATKRRRK